MATSVLFTKKEVMSIMSSLYNQGGKNDSMPNV